MIQKNGDGFLPLDVCLRNPLPSSSIIMLMMANGAIESSYQTHYIKLSDSGSDSSSDS
jgi:hypothetical protein